MCIEDYWVYNNKIEYIKQPILDCDVIKLPLTSPKKGHGAEFEKIEL